MSFQREDIPSPGGDHGLGVHEEDVVQIIRINVIGVLDPLIDSTSDDDSDLEDVRMPHMAAPALSVVPTGYEAEAGSSRSRSQQKRPRLDDPNNVDVSATTEVKVKSFSFLWKLKTFSKVDYDSSSPVFLDEKTGNTWRLKLIRNHEVDDCPFDYCSVYLHLQEFGGEKTENIDEQVVRARFKIAILDGNDRVAWEKGGTHVKPFDFTPRLGWGFERYILEDSLFSTLRKFIVNDTLTLHCILWVAGDIRYSYDTPQNLTKEQMVVKERIRLADDMYKMWNDSVMTDVNINTDSGATFKAHKAVLIGKSPVFAQMLQPNMEEKGAKGPIEILGFGDEVVKTMLEFLYTGSSEQLQEYAPELIEIAEKYELQELMEECEDLMLFQKYNF